MATISARLTRLERAAGAPGVLGFRTFNQVAGTSVYIEPADHGDYRQTLAGGDGVIPAGMRQWTRAEIAALQAEGWRAFIIEWADGDAWRAPGTQASDAPPD